MMNLSPYTRPGQHEVLSLIGTGGNAFRLARLATALGRARGAGLRCPALRAG